MKSIVVVLVCLVSMMSADDKKEKANCCTMTATEEFAALGKNMAFVALHEAPEPFLSVPPNGKMITLKSADSVDANIFVVPSPQPSDNYVLLFHEWWGLNDYIKQEAERIRIELGNVTVIAVDLYDGKIATSPDSARVFVGQVNEERAVAIIKAAIAFAGKKAKIATLGWCFGGSWSMQSALMLGKQAVGCVIYYGMPEKDVKKLSTLRCNILGIFGSQDKFINPEVVAEFQKNMKAAKKKLEVKTYDADHAFANPSNPHHDTAMTADANNAAMIFLRSKFGK
jgi:carboxymethylenebutenolidase